MSNLVRCLMLVCVNICVVFADKVPVLVWSDERSVVLPHPLAGHTMDKTTFRQQYIDVIATNDKHNIVLFIQDKLSLDDITCSAAIYNQNEDEDVFSHLKSIMSSMSVAELSSVSSPSTAIAELKLHFTASSIHHLMAPYQLSDATLNSDGHNLIVVQLPGTAAAGAARQHSLRTIDEIIGSVTSQLKGLSTPFIALYTATKAADQPTMKPSSRNTRQLLQSASDQSTQKKDKEVYLMCNVTDQFFLYASSFFITVNKTAYNLSTAGFDWEVDESGCPTNGSDRCTVVMKYMQSLTELTDLKLTLTTQKTLTQRGTTTGYWYLDVFKVEFTANGSPEEVMLNPAFVDETPFRFSYHCNKPGIIKSINSSEIHANFTDLQIQAFDIKNNRFGYYNDCMGFFSIPIWMALISSAVMLAILLFGIMMLLDIKSMDRFDDPKGKTITITATD